MENNVKAKLIVDVIRRFAAAATADYIRARADEASAQTEYNLWKREQENDFGCHPHDVEIKKEIVARALEEKKAREEVLAYAIDVFLEKISDK